MKIIDRLYVPQDIINLLLPKIYLLFFSLLNSLRSTKKRNCIQAREILSSQNTHKKRMKILT